jgi:hypothetical protein
MKGLNWRIIQYNLAEAREEIQKIEARVQAGKKPSEFEFQIMLEHAYHHLNFAWNIRHAATSRYANLSDEEFNLWSKYPREIKAYRIDKPRKKKSDGQKSATKRGVQ